MGGVTVSSRNGIDGGSLSTAQLDRTAPVAAEAPVGRPGVLRRLGELRETTPGRLQLIMTTLLVLGVLAGLVAGLTAHAAGSGTDSLGNRSQPLLIEAETIYSALADADTTAAQAFLAGGLEPAALTQRYDTDLERATTALTTAARLAPSDSSTAKSIQELASGTAQYAELVATARANNRQGLPVGEAYLSAASTLNRNTLLYQAQSLFRVAQKSVDDGYGDARSDWWVALLTLLLIGLFGTLIVAQRHLSRTTHRTFNVPLVGATLVTAILALSAGGILVAQRTHLHNADTDGSTPVALLADTRILALRERGDEALTLAAHGSGSAYEVDFQAVAKQLNGSDGLLAKAADAVDGDAQAKVEAAETKHTEYLAAHTQVRKLDDDGDYDGAVALAIGPATTATFTAFTDDIGTALEEHKATFTDEIGKAGNGLGLLTVLGPLLALIICGLAVTGIRTRLEEYR
jgi:hypothetical protein